MLLCRQSCVSCCPNQHVLSSWANLVLGRQLLPEGLLRSGSVCLLTVRKIFKLVTATSSPLNYYKQTVTPSRMVQNLSTNLYNINMSICTHIYAFTHKYEYNNINGCSLPHMQGSRTIREIKFVHEEKNILKLVHNYWFQQLIIGTLGEGECEGEAWWWLLRHDRRTLYLFSLLAIKTEACNDKYLT